MEKPLQADNENHWDKKLLKIVTDTPTLCHMDTDYISTRVPMRQWQLAGLSSYSVMAATVVNWMVTGVYFTRELMHKMKKINSAVCRGCENDQNENLDHFLIQCCYYQSVRESYLPQLLEINPNVSELFGNNKKVMLLILDPLHSTL